MVVDFFADLTEVKENLIKTWFLVGYGEEKKEKKRNIRNKISTPFVIFSNLTNYQNLKGITKK